MFGRGEKLYICKETKKIFDKPCEQPFNSIETSMCQLNYLKFVIEEDVIQKLNDLKKLNKKKKKYYKKTIHINI